MLDKKKDVFS